MADPTLRTAVGNYGHTKPLKDGTAVSPRFEMNHVDVSPVTSIFRRMVRNLEFDVSEMALSTYLCARAHGKAFTGIPVFLTRSFYHGGIVYNAKSGIKTAADLAGRRVGVRGYTVTPGVWTRGMLQTVYGLDLNSVTVCRVPKVATQEGPHDQLEEEEFRWPIRHYAPPWATTATPSL